jgi:hypothetical protein
MSNSTLENKNKNKKKEETHFACQQESIFTRNQVLAVYYE